MLVSGIRFDRGVWERGMEEVKVFGTGFGCGVLSYARGRFLI
jgi:hypothetical protein